MSISKNRTDKKASTTHLSIINIFIFIAAVAIVAAPKIAAAQLSKCSDANELILDAQQYGFIHHEASMQRFRLELPSPGILSLIVTTEQDPQRIPRLGLLTHTCDPGTAAPHLILERAPGHLRVATREPATLFFEITSHQPGFALGAFRIANRFIRAQVVEKILPLASGDTRHDSGANDHLRETRFYVADVAIKSDPMEVDPDPGVRTPPPSKFSDPTLPIKSDPMEVDPDPGILAPPYFQASQTQDDSPWIATLLSFESAAGLETLATRRPQLRLDPRVHDGRGLCDLWSQSRPHREPDDHGDSPGCATSITPGESMTGTISARGDDDLPDRDVFELTLHELTPLEVTTHGETDTSGVLYDRTGQPLAIDDDSGEGDNFRLAVVLAPGEYYLQISGRGGPHGRYRLTTKDLKRR